ncbi:MAG: CapA family protein [Lachnospiraceae bacterium]|nr:CapA family protein [Lachnospiraceae bacterium]
MKKRLSAVLSVMLVMMMLVSACGNSDKANTETITAETTESTEQASEDTTLQTDDTESNYLETQDSAENTTSSLATEENTTKKTEEPTTKVVESEEPTTEEASTSGSNVNEDYKPVTMAFVGDMYLSDKLYSNYTKSGLTGFLGQSILDIFQKTDIMIANHEYVATDLPEEAKDTQQLYNFKSPVAREILWKEMGVDIVSLANNHAMDYGEQSLLDCLDALDAIGIARIGAGKNLADALKADIRIVNGKKIAVLAASRFIVSWEWYAQTNKPGVMTTYESTDRYKMMKDEIKRLKEEEKCDIVAVYVHFGQEKSYELTSNQPVIAHGYIDAGADFVIGSHAHNLQGIEIYKGAPIYYNLGNFLFSNYVSDTMVVNIAINADNSVSTRITPCVSKQYSVQEATGTKAQEIYDFIESISVNVRIDENGNVTEKVE